MAQSTVQSINISKLNNTNKTAADWVRQLRFSPAVNKSTVGVQTDRVTPDLLLKSSSKLLSISKGQVQDDKKDSLQYQRIYGPVEYFAQRVQKDGGNVARTLLWKATTKGNLDSIPVNSLQPHIRAVFNDLGLSNFVDNTTPLDGIDNSMKLTRVGEGGISSQEVAPIEMRLVQPSYYGYVDSIRTAQKCYSADTLIFTKTGWKCIAQITLQDQLATLIDGRPEWNKPLQIQRYQHDGLMYGFQNWYIDFLVTPGHRMYVGNQKDPSSFSIQPIDQVYGNSYKVMCGCQKQMLTDDNQRWFYFPKEEEHELTKVVDKVDIVDFAAFLGWYLAQGCCEIRQNWPASKGLKYRVKITQSPKYHPQNYQEIRALIQRLPFGAHPKCAAQKLHGLDLVINRKQLCKYLMQFGDSFHKFIPEWIFQAPVKAKWAFVQAILKGDGANQRDLCTVSQHLAKDMQRLLFQLGQSSSITKQHQHYISVVTGKQAQDIYKVTWHKWNYQNIAKPKPNKATSGRCYYTTNYKGTVYCPTVPGGLVYIRRPNASKGIWCGNSPGITAFMTKNVMKGSDGKLYQKMLNMHTGKQQYVDSQKAAASVVTTNQYLGTKDKYVYAMGGDKGIRIVPFKSVDYILPHADDAYSLAANNVHMLSGVKAMRLLMGCLHPDTPVVVFNTQGYTDIVPAKAVGLNQQHYVIGCDQQGNDTLYPVKAVVARYPDRKRKFRRVVTSSGRVLLTSPDHKWYIYTDKGFKKIKAQQLKEGMKVPRSLFLGAPVRVTQLLGTTITTQICTLLGRILRSLTVTSKKIRFSYTLQQEHQIDIAMQQLGVAGFSKYKKQGHLYCAIDDQRFLQWLDREVGIQEEKRRVPKAVLSLPQGYTAVLLEAFSKQLDNVGQDINGDVWLLDIQSGLLRDGLAFMLSKIYTDTKYRDSMYGSTTQRALQLFPAQNFFGDIIFDTITAIYKQKNPGMMIDLDCDDHVYACANGLITHNSKYALQAVPLQEREAPLVQSLDEASGKTMDQIIGKKLGSQWAPKSGIVQAVRDDRIDMLYDDGTKGSVQLYKNFPANAKGWLTNYPKVKAGQRVAKGQLLAPSNYTDDKGVSALGRNLRIGYLSYKGGTFQDGCTISESAAKKMAYTTMYKTAMDIDRTIRTGKSLYNVWKPGNYNKQQMQNLDDDGVVKVGSVINKGDPMILGIQTTEPSPGTMGKRLLTDVSQVWEHAHPGTVTDVVRTKNGVRVYATVSSPFQVGDKMSAIFGNKAVVAKILPDEQMPKDSKGRPLELLFDPLGIVSRCYDKQTQFLTRDGWKLGKDVLDTDQLYSFDPQTNTCHWSKQLEPMYKKHYTGKLYGARTRVGDFLVTTGHRFWARTDAKGSKFKQVTVDQIYGKRYVIPALAPYKDSLEQSKFQLPKIQIKTKDAYTSSDSIFFDAGDWAQFLGWYLEEGNTTYVQGQKSSYRVHIAQNDQVNPAKCARITQLLNKLGFNYHYGRKNKQFHITNKRLAAYTKQFGYCDQKYIPQWLFKQPTQIILRFLQALILGDGHIAKVRQTKTGADVTTKSIHLTSQKLIDQLQILLLQHGIMSSKCPVKADKRYQHAKPMYRLGISTVPKTTKIFTKKSWYTVDYDDMVYCPTVDTGYVQTRRHGKLLIAHNTNPAQMIQTALGKVAQKTGKPVVVPQFFPKGGSRLKWAKDLLKQYNVPWKQNVTDPQTGRTISNVFTGLQYFIPLKHISDTKMSDRGTDSYTAQQVPASGGQTGSKRLGGLQVASLVTQNAFNFLTTDAKRIRGQSNHQFWRSLRTGQVPTIPGQPLVHRKFFAHLQGAGMHIRKTTKGVSIMALTNSDVNQLAGNRELKTRDTYQQKTFRPMDGGLFGKDIFGQNGKQWGYIQLDEPLPNPVMQQPLARILKMRDQDFQAVVTGSKEVNGLKSASDIKAALSKININKQTADALQQLKAAKPSVRDAALKRYVALAQMRDNNKRPQQYMLDKIPVLPPQFRPVSTHSGLTMVADSNYLYAQMLDARNDVRDAKDLPQQYQQDARKALYRSWKQLVGLYDPQNPKLQSKNVGGLLKWALGVGRSPKNSAYSRKVLGAAVDTVGRAVGVPDSRLKLNQVGVPQSMAWGIFAPFVTRKLVQANYSPLDAMKMVKQHSPIARDFLLSVMDQRPVVVNRAPSLHKYNLYGAWPKLVTGTAMHWSPSICDNMSLDADGDSCKSLIMSVLTPEVWSELCGSSKKCNDLTFSQSVLQQSLSSKEHGAPQSTLTMKGPQTMFDKATKMELLHRVMALEDLPVVEGSEVKKSDTVTEWDVKPGVFVNTVDPATGDLTFAAVTKVSKHENLEMVDVQFTISNDYPHMVTCSTDHSLITMNPMTMELEKSTPAESVGRCVPVAARNVANGYEDANAMCQEISFPSGVRRMDYDMGLFLGLMIGDGWVVDVSKEYSKEPQYSAHLACCEESLQKFILKFSAEQTSVPFTKQAALFSYSSQNNEQRFSKNDMQRFTFYMTNEDKHRLLGLIGHGAHNKKIPALSMVACKEHLLGLLCGLLATDGNVGYTRPGGDKKTASKIIRYDTVSPLLRDGIQQLAHRLGVKTSVYEYSGSATGSHAYAIRFCLEDIVRLYDTNPTNFHIPVDYKQDNLMAIVEDIHKSKAADGSSVKGYDLVPLPYCLMNAFSWADIKTGSANPVTAQRGRQYVQRSVAKRLLSALQRRDFSKFTPVTSKGAKKYPNTKESILLLVEKWAKIVNNTDIQWEVVDKVTPSECTEGWDCTVPGPYTFSLNTGTIVQDTLNIHVPVSKKAVQEVIDNMMPQRMAILPRSHKAAYMPQKSFMQGIYVATRMGQAKGQVKTFADLAQAKKAYREGTIDIDTPIRILK